MPDQDTQAPRGPKPTFQDLTLYDVDTGEPFIFSAKEQEFFWKQGFTQVPKHSPERRKMLRLQREAEGKKLYNIRCAACGKVGRILQEPADPKKVLCSDCFATRWEEYLQKNPAIRAEHEAAEAKIAAEKAEAAQYAQIDSAPVEQLPY